MIDRGHPQWPVVKWPIDIDDRLQAMTRNGLVHCQGVEVHAMIDMPEKTKRLRIAPVTGRGRVANAYIEIPMDNVGELIEVLSEMRTEYLTAQSPGVNMTEAFSRTDVFDVLLSVKHETEEETQRIQRVYEDSLNRSRENFQPVRAFLDSIGELLAWHPDSQQGAVPFKLHYENETDGRSVTLKRTRNCNRVRFTGIVATEGGAPVCVSDWIPSSPDRQVSAQEAIRMIAEYALKRGIQFADKMVDTHTPNGAIGTFEQTK